MPQRLGRHHTDVDRTFWGWNDIWLDPRFRAWNIEAFLRAITTPILVIQGEDDEYGTAAQVAAIAAQSGSPVETLMLPECRHSPHRDQPDAVLNAMTTFVNRLAE